MNSKFDRRTLIADLAREENQHRSVIIAGFVGKVVKFTNYTNLFIRDCSGGILVSFSKIIPPLRRESVVLIEGRLTFTARQDEYGCCRGLRYELLGDELELLSKAQPIPIELGPEKISDEKFRMKYRYLDLRREQLKQNLIFASKAKHLASKYLHEKGFIELDSPILSFPSNEGAQTFSTIPKHSVKNSFTLAQSPQLYKQLLMLSGFERYFQFAKSFRAEELREDRQYEFTQLDLELSFSTVEKLSALVEELINLLVTALNEHLKALKKEEMQLSFQKMSYLEAMTKYGSDKPDLRNSLQIRELFEEEGYTAKECEKECCYSLIFEVKGENHDWLESLGKSTRYLHKNEKGQFSGNYDHLLHSFQAVKELPLNSYLIYILSPSLERQNLIKLGQIRERLFKLGVIENTKVNSLSFLWITEWDYFERDREQNLKTVHHPFALPQFNTLDALLKQDSIHWKSTSYDLVLNGVEIASGSERINIPELQREVFRRLGYTEDLIKREFGWFLQAFEFGAPPHLGIAIGWERLIATLIGSSSIKDVIPFPKNSKGICSMSASV